MMYTIEGNKLIAEFMGMVETAPNIWEDITTGSGVIVILGEYRPHADWNELMPVVEKIRNDHFVNIEMYGDFVATWVTKDKDYPKEEQKIYSQHKDAITSIYEAVIQFIKWYNQNK